MIDSISQTAGEHRHDFGQQAVQAGERRTLMVVIVTALMMVVEIAAGLFYGSMALLADGLHMASHTAALGLSYAAYVLARRYALDSRYSFGSGKMNSLAAYTSAVMLGLFALIMAYESVMRMLHPVTITIDQAIFVAVIGLIVNGVSVWILQGGHHHHPDEQDHHAHEHDHNLRAAYLHVVADALTSVLAIFALLGAKYLGWNWLDPLMGIVGAVLVARWSIGLSLVSARVLLDRQAPQALLHRIREALESAGGKVTDLHVWSIGPGIYAAAIEVQRAQKGSAAAFRQRLGAFSELVHVTLEVTES
ncbi:MAG TPA: CDF family Co(II)/Ni(II) efflux transporter DmeF [bacterium]|jgi:cation diffusion facilitator family transporter